MKIIQESNLIKNLNLIKNDIYEAKEEWSSHVIDCLVKEDELIDVDMLFWCTIFAVELGWIEDSHDLLLSDSGGAYNDNKVWSYLNHNVVTAGSTCAACTKNFQFCDKTQWNLFFFV